MLPNPSDQTRVEVLLRAADRDTATAETLVQHAPHLHESVGFSCQQLVEKYAKAVLITNGLPAPFIHVLVKLLVPLVQASIIALDSVEMDSAAILQDFAVELRYETDDAPSYTPAASRGLSDVILRRRFETRRFRFSSRFRPLPASNLTIDYLMADHPTKLPMITEAQIQAIVQRIVDGYAPDRIILFGSYAYGTPTEDSDLDLLVVKAGIGPERTERAVAVRRLLRGAGAPMDILVRTPQEFAAAAAVRFTIEAQAAAEGRLLYAAA